MIIRFLISVLVLTMAITNHLLAQTEKGNWALGITAGVGSEGGQSINSLQQENKYPTTNRYQIMPNLSYFLSSKWAIGLAAGYQSNSGGTSLTSPNTNTQRYVSNYAGLVVSPHIKHYIPVGERASIVLGLHPSITVGKSDSYYYSVGNTTSNGIIEYRGRNNQMGYSIGFKPAFLFFPAEKWGVELSLGNLLYYSMDQFNFDKDPHLTVEKETVHNYGMLDVNTFGLGVSLFYFIK